MTAVLTRPLPRPPTPRQPETVEPPVDVVDQWGMHSFPASDPPANW